MVVFTVGYEGRTIDEFVGNLAAQGIELLVDVRELPLSRKKGFSKTTLSSALQGQGIDYLHVRELGTPRALRQKLRKTGDYEGFFAAYAEHLRDHGTAMQELIQTARENAVCLMCFEKDHAQCHRSVLASQLQSVGFQIRHI